MKVKAIEWDTNLIDSLVGRPRTQNEVFEVTNDRYEVLKGCNQIKLEVVEKVANAKLETKKETRKAKK